jgi:hypothetical protein
MEMGYVLSDRTLRSLVSIRIVFHPLFHFLLFAFIYAFNIMSVQRSSLLALCFTIFFFPIQIEWFFSTIIMILLNTISALET